MDNLNVGVNSEWFQKSQEKVKEINNKRGRSSYLAFSRKVYPFRIDEIMIDLKTEQKIFVEHRKDEAPVIYTPEIR